MMGTLLAIKDLLSAQNNKNEHLKVFLGIAPCIPQPHLAASKFASPFLQSTQKMDGRRLEWSRCLEGGPGSWSLIDSDGTAFTAEAAPRWHLLLFSTDFVERLLHCRFVQWHPEDAQVAVFEAEELDYDAWVSYPAGKVYVREVPSPFVVTCSLTPVAHNVVDAVFTTVAGGELLRIAGVSNLLPEMEELATSAASAAAAQGRLQSRNQAVCTALDGQVVTVVLSHDMWDMMTAQDAQGIGCTS